MPQPYGTVIKGGQIVQCTHKVVSNIMPYVRHGTQLIPCSVEWTVCDSEADFVIIIGKPTLRTLGMENRSQLGVEYEKLGRDANVRKNLENPAQVIIRGTGPVVRFSH